MSRKELFDSSDVGKRFKRWLRRKGYTSASLAKATGLSESTVERLCRGRYTLRTIGTLEEYTDIDISWLLDGVEGAAPDTERTPRSSTGNYSRATLSKGVAELNDTEATFLTKKLIDLYKSSIDRSKTKSFDEIFTPYAMSHNI